MGLVRKQLTNGTKENVVLGVALSEPIYKGTINKVKSCGNDTQFLPVAYLKTRFVFWQSVCLRVTFICLGLHMPILIQLPLFYILS